MTFKLFDTTGWYNWLVELGDTSNYQKAYHKTCAHLTCSKNFLPRDPEEVSLSGLEKSCVWVGVLAVGIGRLNLSIVRLVTLQAIKFMNCMRVWYLFTYKSSHVCILYRLAKSNEPSRTYVNCSKSSTPKLLWVSILPNYCWSPCSQTLLVSQLPTTSDEIRVLWGHVDSLTRHLANWMWRRGRYQRPTRVAQRHPRQEPCVMRCMMVTRDQIASSPSHKLQPSPNNTRETTRNNHPMNERLGYTSWILDSTILGH